MISSKYTTVLNNLLENEETKPLIDKALSSYPLYTSTSKEEFKPVHIPTREELNKKILNFYKYREIGFETVYRFVDELEIAMNEIMPYYNELFFTADQDYNIIYNVDYKKTIDLRRENTHSNNTESIEDIKNVSENNTTATDETITEGDTSDDSKNVKSSTPQSELSITAENIESVSYADEVNWNKNNAYNKGKSTGTNTAYSETSSNTEGKNNVYSEGGANETESTLETTKGNFGVVSAQDLILKYRETILNIEQMIINDKRLSECFMLVY